MDTGCKVRFSLIIPAYNSARTIAACLQSVLGQSYQNFEILVIDGLSADDTVAIVNSLNSDKIRLTSEKDTGIYDAMNKGIQQAKGEWLYFLGSDDALYNPAILDRVDETIAANTATRIIHGDVITSTGVVERYPEYKFWELVTERCICHQAIFYHRSLFNGRLYDTRYKMCADWDFNLKVFAEDVHPVYIPLIIAKFSLDGLSGNWQEHPEYLEYFADRKKLVTRYKGNAYLPYYYMRKLFKKIKAKLF